MVSNAEVKKLEQTIQEKEDEISKLVQELEASKQKVGSMMIKYSGESKRQQEEISQLRKQLEAGEQTGADMKATLYLLDQAKEAEKKAQEKI